MAFNWAQGGQGAAGGAISGATMGAPFGPVGAGVGAAAGGLLGLVSGFSGKKNKFDRAPLTPQEQAVNDLLLSNAQRTLQDPYQGFAPIEQAARSGFSQQTIPALMERFAGSGDNSLSSPAFASQQLGAARGLEESLAALRAQFGQQAQNNALAQIKQGMSPAYQQLYNPEPGFGSQLLGQGMQLLPGLSQQGAQWWQQREQGQADMTGQEQSPFGMQAAQPSSQEQMLNQLKFLLSQNSGIPQSYSMPQYYYGG